MVEDISLQEELQREESWLRFRDHATKNSDMNTPIKITKKEIRKGFERELLPQLENEKAVILNSEDFS